MTKRLILLMFVVLGLVATSFGEFVSVAPVQAHIANAPLFAHPTRTAPNPHNFTVQSVTDGQNVLWMQNSAWAGGVKLYMSTGRNVDLHNSASPWDTYMLHAMRPPNGACLEVVVEQGREADNTMHHYLSLYPWCGAYYDRTYDIEITSAFAADYARTFSWHNWDISNPVSYNDETILVKIEKTTTSTNCWRGSIYNFNTSTWTVIGNPTSVCGTPHESVPARNDGWQSFEEHFKSNTVCGTLGTYHTLQGRDMMYQTGVGSGWYDLNTSDVTFDDSGATRCIPNPWDNQHVDVYQPAGYVLCAAAVNTNCD